MTSNKHVDLKKLENFVRSNCYPEDKYWKIARKKADVKNLIKDIKGKKGWYLTMIENCYYHNTSLFFIVIPCSFTTFELQTK